jgi:hypothetical protein
MVWSWTSKRESVGNPDSPLGSPSQQDSSGGKRKPRAEWRVVLRDSAGAGVHLSWHDAGLVAAQRALQQQVLDMGSEGGQAGAGAAASVDAFLAGAVLVKIERLPGSEKTAAVALEALPFNAPLLTSLKVLRLAGEALLSDAVIGMLLQPSLREVDLPGQKLTAERLASLFGPGAAPSSPRPCFPELGCAGVSEYQRERARSCASVPYCLRC